MCHTCQDAQHANLPSKSSRILVSLLTFATPCDTERSLEMGSFSCSTHQTSTPPSATCMQAICRKDREATFNFGELDTRTISFFGHSLQSSSTHCTAAIPPPTTTSFPMVSAVVFGLCCQAQIEDVGVFVGTVCVSAIEAFDH